MRPVPCIAIETSKFPVLEGEEEEIVNEGMYGKALCRYLERNLPKTGIDVPFYGAEDWGWWLAVEENGFSMGLCIYCRLLSAAEPGCYAILPSLKRERQWSWSAFRFVDVTARISRIMDAVETVFLNDPDITRVTRQDDFPF